MSSTERPKQYISQLHREYTDHNGKPASEDITKGSNYPESPHKLFFFQHQDATIPHVYAILPHPENISSFVVFKDDGTATKDTKDAQKISGRYYKPEPQHVTPDEPFVIGQIREGETLVIKVKEFQAKPKADVTELLNSDFEETAAD